MHRCCGFAEQFAKAEWLPADRGHDADRFRDAVNDNGIKPSTPSWKSRDKPIGPDKRRCKRRNGIEIMFGRLRDWRRVATRVDRCPEIVLAAVAASVMFWFEPSTSLERVGGRACCGARYMVTTGVGRLIRRTEPSLPGRHQAMPGSRPSAAAGYASRPVQSWRCVGRPASWNAQQAKKGRQLGRPLPPNAVEQERSRR